MKRLKITIEVMMKGDPSDMPSLKEEVYQRVMEDIEKEDLEFEVEDLDEEEDEYEDL